MSNLCVWWLESFKIYILCWMQIFPGYIKFPLRYIKFPLCRRVRGRRNSKCSIWETVLREELGCDLLLLGSHFLITRLQKHHGVLHSKMILLNDNKGTAFWKERMLFKVLSELRHTRDFKRFLSTSNARQLGVANGPSKTLGLAKF